MAGTDLESRWRVCPQPLLAGPPIRQLLVRGREGTGGGVCPPYLSLLLPAQSSHFLPETVAADLRAGAGALAHPGVVALVTGGRAGGAPGARPGEGHLQTSQSP